MRAKLRHEPVKVVDEDLSVLRSDACTVQRGECARVTPHERLCVDDHAARGVLGDPHGGRQFQPDRPLDDFAHRRTPALRFREQLSSHRIDAHQPLGCEHRLHRRSLDHEVDRVRDGCPVLRTLRVGWVEVIGIAAHRTILVPKYDTSQRKSA